MGVQMKYMKGLVIILLFLFAAGVRAQTSYSFGEGLNAAKTQNKIVVINIYSDDDKWSQKMQSEVYSDAKIQQLLNSDFIYIKLNGQSQESYTYKDKTLSAGDLAKSFGVTGYPTHVFLTPSGEVITFKYNNVDAVNFPGFTDKEDFNNILLYFKDGKYKTADLSTVL
jgi:thioredoxin-related protein